MHFIRFKNSSLVSQCCKDDEHYPSHPFAHQPCVYIPSIWLHYYLYYRRLNQKNPQWPPRKSKHIWAKPKWNADFSHMNHCHSKIFTVCDYAGFSHAKFLPWDLWECLHLYVKSSSDHDNSQLKNNLVVWYGKNGKPKPLLNGFKALKARPKRIIWIFAVIPFVDTNFYVACCSVDGMAAWF